MSPEQAKGKTADRRADIWSFGVLLWEMLTGRPLFEGETATEILAQALTKGPDLSRVPFPLRRLLRMCLQKDPKQRLRSVGNWEMLPEEPARMERRRPAWLAWALAALLAVAGSWGWLRRGPQNSTALYSLHVA